MKTSRAAVLVVWFVCSSFAVGYLFGRYDKRSPARPDPAEQICRPPVGDITILRPNRPAESGVPYRFRPHSYAVDGKSVVISPAPSSEVWIVTIDNGRWTLGVTPVTE